ncbi:MAG TPA: Fe-S cluster assembly protein SufD [Pseudomonadales bacterium]|nr:Fe-S cluster assembly protein SufD [Pseudomonadales bacterium]
MSTIDQAQFTTTALARAETLAGAATDAPDGVLTALRAAGREALAAADLPGRKTESWKYSRVGALLEEGLLDRPRDDVAPVAVADLAGAPAARLLFVDGALRTVDALPDGVTVQRFSALEGPLASLVAERLGSLAPATARPFVALGASLLDDGVVVHVAADCRVEAPLELVFAQGDDEVPCGGHARVLVVVEAGARATLVERQLGTRLRFTNTVIEAFVEANARLDHLRLALDAGDGRWLSALDVAVADGGRYGLHQALVGAAFRRSEIRLWTRGPGAHIEVGGATLTRDRTHLDTQMSIEHAAPHGTSNQTFRSIAGERSRTVLNGRIHIHPDAQKTAAQFSTRNLLLSANAEIDAKPELEIYADDVTCAHGATVGRLDDGALFYLRARGIDEATARTMLAFAFLAAVVADFPLTEVGAQVRAQLEAAFSAPALEAAA